MSTNHFDRHPSISCGSIAGLKGIVLVREDVPLGIRMFNVVVAFQWSFVGAQVNDSTSLVATGVWVKDVVAPLVIAVSKSYD